MHVNAKKMAFLGLLLSVDVILVVLSSILEFNTLFLLAAASFCVGIAIREAGLKLGSGFYLASLILSIILSPNKFYCITYGALGLYLVVDELAFDRLVKVTGLKNRKAIFWIIKYVVFNLMYLPMLFFMPGLIYNGNINPMIIAALAVLGQLALLVYDRAYEYFQKYIWGNIRNKLQF